MKYIYIKRTPVSAYAADKFEENYHLGVLADWFTDDVRNHVDSWREWLDE